MSALWADCQIAPESRKFSLTYRGGEGPVVGPPKSWAPRAATSPGPRSLASSFAVSRPREVQGPTTVGISAVD